MCRQTHEFHYHLYQQILVSKHYEVILPFCLFQTFCSYFSCQIHHLFLYYLFTIKIKDLSPICFLFSANQCCGHAWRARTVPKRQISTHFIDFSHCKWNNIHREGLSCRFQSHVLLLSELLSKTIAVIDIKNITCLKYTIVNIFLKNWWLKLTRSHCSLHKYASNTNHVQHAH